TGPSAQAYRFLFAAFFFGLSILFGDRSHLLGDTSKWFSILDQSLLSTVPLSSMPAHFNRLDVPGFEYINVQQSLDVLVHFQTLRIGHELLGWDAVDAYEAVSSIAGIPFAIALWGLAFSLPLRTRDNLTILFCLASLGVSQLFFGYGESYTLVTAASAFYLLSGLRTLRGHSGLAAPTLLLGLAVAFHLMALSLLPSWLYLAWQHEVRKSDSLWLRRRVVVPSLVILCGTGLFVYLRLYRGLHMPLWDAGEEGLYPILSFSHLGNLVNEVLLIGPFGLLWGVTWRRGRDDSPGHFVALAGLGGAALVLVHYISMAGRDWDLMSFPSLAIALFGCLCIVRRPDHRSVLRQVRWIVLPVMLLHTGLWIGINHNPDRAVERLGNLLRYTPNQPLHYQHFVRGHYLLNVHENSADSAAATFRLALDETPPDDLINQRRYRKNLAQALVAAQRYDEAISWFDLAYAGQRQLVAASTDLAFHAGWIGALIERARNRQGAGADAFTDLEQAIRKARSVVATHGSTRISTLLGRALHLAGRPQEAIDVLAEVTGQEQHGEESARVLVFLAESLQATGRRAEAIERLGQALQTSSHSSDIHFNLGNLYFTDGQLERAIKSYTTAIDLRSNEPRLYVNAARAHVARGDLNAAARTFRTGLERCQSARLYQGYGDLLMQRGDFTGALDAYRSSLKLAPDNDDATNSLGWCFYKTGRLNKAAVFFRSVLERSMHAQFNFALVLLAQGEHQAAADAYATALEEHGVQIAQQIGAVGDLQELVDRAGNSPELEELLRMMAAPP
ncbi:MAG: tetratricopeptide repeat protein, partial [Candidatus Latescibacteria bacterium]|nr:tetratricopeptide repeat protein [Candidatus Latescibacterota bacterium]